VPIQCTPSGRCMTPAARPAAGSVSIKGILKPGELLAGQSIKVVILQYRVVGPQLTSVTPELTQAISQTFQVN